MFKGNKFVNQFDYLCCSAACSNSANYFIFFSLVEAKPDANHTMVDYTGLSSPESMLAS